MHTEIRELIAAMKADSPDRAAQKAITPKLLRYMAAEASLTILNHPTDHATDLIIGAYFFAMRACEFTWSSRKGKTKIIRLGGIKFYDCDRNEIPHEDPDLVRKAEYVWILFEDQKNGERNESRSQRKSFHRILCPVLQFARAVQRV